MNCRTKLCLGLRTAWRTLRLTLLLSCILFLLGGAAVPPGGLVSAVRSLTRPVEFDFSSWTLNAAAAKVSSWAFSFNRFLTPEQQSQWVLNTLEGVERVNTLTAEMLLIYANPAVSNQDAASRMLKQELQAAQERLAWLAPTAETILQTQLAHILNDIGMNVLGQVIPPSLYRSTDVPYSLVISPRDRIEQALDVSLLPGITAEVMDHMENQIFTVQDHAALVVPIGGIGTYPTMVMQTNDIVWLTEVIAHEWVHNFLTLHPLGLNYFTNSKLRTINETTASLAGKELGRLILEKFYPAYVPQDSEPTATGTALQRPEPEPNTFDFRREMRTTRMEVDRLLDEGNIEDAELYMETRRQFFWQNGFPIRKLNQAYFAFYGAYNDAPGGGAAGEDPVGPAVVAYRDQFDTLANFLKAIAWVDSYDAFLRLLDT